MLAVVLGALGPEGIIAPVLAGDGVATTRATAKAYTAMAMRLNAAAANTDSSMLQMSSTFQALTADQAQAAFRKHAVWLREQAAVAEATGQLLDRAADISSAAKAAMAVLAAKAAQVRIQEGIALGGGFGPLSGAAFLEAEAELMALRGAALGVMAGYAAALVPTLAALPPPIAAPPIVTGGPGPGPQTEYASFDNPTDYNGSDFTKTDTTSTSTGDGPTGSDNNTGTGDQKPGDTTQPSDHTQPTDPTQPADPLDPATNPEQLSPDPNGNGWSGDSGMNGMGDGATDQSWFYGTSQNSPTLAALSGGAGSLVALNMARGGLGSMPGAATGFRMPASWNPGAGRAFGAMPQQAASGPMARKGPPRGALAPKARMRRRRDDEKRSSKVFVPGEPQDVPVLEQPPVIGVIEYEDRDSREEPTLESALAVGVIERNENEDEAVLASAERPR
ncbi:PPE domain-containing protein [Nocardia asiatica]|uniref:PPE domain-containing protein n=1 Tax=Nocardia asiatica TaxID=209252 RepID=UPI002457735C|nr:PPE domain-containing protein [Nocardia asiatica]